MSTQRGTVPRTGGNQVDMDQLNREYSRNQLAIGVISFAAILMILIGSVHVIGGIAEVLDNEMFVITRNYAYKFDVSTWGWIHIGMGVLVAVTGVSLFSGHILAIIAGVVVAILSMITNFMFMPAYPFWSTLVIAIDIVVIWALTTHGRVMANRDFT